MELEYVYIKDFLNSDTQLRKGDYIYKHDKNQHPLKSEYDLANLYFITESKNHIVSGMNMSDKKELNVDLETSKDHWWTLRIPSIIRKQIGLE